MYAFSPYVVSKALGYFNLLSVEWVPLALLITLKTLESATFKRMILVSFLLIVLFFTDFHYFYYYFFIVSFFLIFNLRKIKPRNFLFFGSSILISLIVISVIYLPAIFSYLNEKQSYVRGYFQTITWYNFFLPSPFTMIYNFFPQDIIRLYTASPVYMVVDSVVYYGISFIFLTLLFLFLCIKERINTNEIHFLIALFLFSSFLALGSSTLPSLVVNDILRKVLPFFNILAVPARHSFLSLFSFISIFSYILYNFLNKTRKYQMEFFTLLTILFVVEYFPINYYFYYRVDSPAIISQLSLIHQDFTILNIPHIENTQGMYLQTIHQKRILDGHISRVNLESKKTLKLIEILTKDVEKEELEKLLKQLNVRYIIVDYNYSPTNYDFSLLNIIKFIKSIKLIEKSERLEVYEVS